MLNKSQEIESVSKIDNILVSLVRNFCGIWYLNRSWLTSIGHGIPYRRNVFHLNRCKKLRLIWLITLPCHSYGPDKKKNQVLQMIISLKKIKVQTKSFNRVFFEL